MAENGKHLVFLYGTLKKGEPNHEELFNTANSTATYIGAAQTIKRFPLIIASRYNIPFLLYHEGKGKNIIGELYEVNDQKLADLDVLECHPKYYERIIEEVRLISDDRVQETVLKPWIYFIRNFRPVLLDLPFLETYCSKGSHGLEYVSRYTRPPGPHYSVEIMREGFI